MKISRISVSTSDFLMNFGADFCKEQHLLVANSISPRSRPVTLNHPYAPCYFCPVSVCRFCSEELPEGKIFRTSLCPSCGNAVKVCLNCSFYTPGAHWDCRETIPEAVREKDKANFCDYFVVATGKSNSRGAGKIKKKSDNARNQFDNLFGD